MLMNAAKALMTASLAFLLVQIPLAHTAVPVMRDTLEMERQAAKFHLVKMNCSFLQYW